MTGGRLALIFIFLLAGLTTAAAHMPYAACARKGDLVRCAGGFTGGRSVAGVRVDVVADDETVLIKGAFDDVSTFSFRQPARGYYVLLDAGPGHTVEVDDQEIANRR